MRLGSAGTLSAALSIASLLACNPTSLPPDTLVVTNVRLFDGTGGPAVDDARVVIVDGRIEACGPASEVEVPSAALIIDGHGSTLLPGLIDAHVHLTSAQRRDPAAAVTWLRAGVTTLGDMGTRSEPATLRRQLAADPTGSPRLLIAGPIVTAPGGYPFVGPRSSALEIASVDEADRILADLLDGPRVDHLKLAFDRGFTQDLDEDGWPVLDPAVLRRITALAHAKGLRVSAHVTQPGELAAVLEAGVDNAAHTPAEPISESLLERLAAADFVLISTASLWVETPDRLAVAQSNLRRYLDLGGRVALGTDAPGFQEPGLPLGEMRLLLDAGLTSSEVLVAATRDAAFAFGRAHELGRIAPATSPTW